MVFMDMAATIPTGSMCERLKWSGFIWMSFFLTMFTDPLIPVAGCGAADGWLKLVRSGAAPRGLSAMVRLTSPAQA